MCRNIIPLFNYEPVATSGEIRAAAEQYVRKISGMVAPSARNQATFDRAVDTVAIATRELIDDLETSAAPKDRAVEAEKRRQRSAARFNHEGH